MKHKTLLIVAALALVAAGCGRDDAKTANNTAGDNTTTAASGDEKAVAIVNGVSIPESRIGYYVQELGGSIPEGQRQAVIDNIIQSEVISQQAEKDGMREDLRQQLIVSEQRVLGRAYVTKFLEGNPVTEADISALYETLTQGADKEYETAHILVEDEGQANALLAQVLATPDSFSQLAADNSKDPGSAQNSGSIGWVSPGGLVPPFAEAMQKTGKGKIYPEVVKTDFGWHIIRVDDIREANIPPLDDQIRGQLRQQATAQKIVAHIKELSDAAKIERLDNADTGDSGAEEKESES